MTEMPRIGLRIVRMRARVGSRNSWLAGWQATPAEDAHTMTVCKQHGVIEEGEPVRLRRSRK